MVPDELYPAAYPTDRYVPLTLDTTRTTRRLLEEGDDVLVAFSLDTAPFVEAMHRVTKVCRESGTAILHFLHATDLPLPPTREGRTARQYRAARRAYRRQLTTYRKANR